MQYDAITLDTNIFYENGYNLEEGLLGLLTQFSEGSAEFILSEIVLREIHRHLVNSVNKVSDSLLGAIDKSKKNGIIPEDQAEQLEAFNNILDSPENIVKERLDKFTKATGATIISAEGVDIKLLVARYFEPAPPFESSAKKKNEFPDALALLSLENWAKEKNKKILAISNDRGWQEFGEASAAIDVEDDLPAALQKFQEHVEEAEKFFVAFINKFAAGELPDAFNDFYKGIEAAVSTDGQYGTADAFQRVEVEQVELHFIDGSLVKVGEEPAFDIVRIGKDMIVVNVPIHVDAEAHGACSFYHYDSIDKDEIYMGCYEARTEIEFIAHALLTLEGEFDEGVKAVEITDVEVVGIPEEIDFGYVELEYEPDDY